MSISTWSPPRRFALESVLYDGSLGGLRVGDARDRIETVLGPPEAPPQRIGRKGKLWSWLYGNVSVLVANGRVEGIELDFEGNRLAMVEAGDMARWSLVGWRAFAERKRWTLRETTPVVSIVAPHAIVALDSDGALHVVSLRTAPTSE